MVLGRCWRRRCWTRSPRKGCLLVMLPDRFRESTESGADLLRDGRWRGMTAPVLAVDDSALGFWKAARDVFPRHFSTDGQEPCCDHQDLGVASRMVVSAARRAP